MNRILLPLCIILLSLSFAAGGCSWMGKTAGKAQAKIERKANEVEQGYHRGYTEEKKKEAPQKQDEEPNS
ncbi:MAG: hypothetical protein LBP38_04610 [Desulfovibrio sp.]|jgi:hypothetical protein|nr:hypothetical protein [Desulfovibrio sp.]